MQTAIATNEDHKVEWAGKKTLGCYPGLTGYVMKIADKDDQSYKIWWNDRNGYTWERRKNLCAIIEL